MNQPPPDLPLDKGEEFVRKPYPFLEGIDLHVEGRISTEEAMRQEKTAREILRRFVNQPGLILADEVGMGKTFVALTVAACVALDDDQQRPVVVMVPPSLKEKWPRDFELFREKCMPIRAAANFRSKSADRAVEFLKILDDPQGKKRSLIFLTHGAMYRGLQDGWVKLALIYRALYKRKNTADLRRALCRSMGRLLQMSWIDRQNPDIWEKLLDHDPEDWLRVLQRHGIDPEGDDSVHTDDDPVPELIRKALWDLNTDTVYDALYKIPFRQSENFDVRLMDARRGINEGLKELWSECIHSVRFTLPLLILDEAHHLKNARTQLASLFQQEEAKEDAEEISRGPLAHVFERMLFLTATPFQLGHEELCSVLDRFEGIAWQIPEKAPQMDKPIFSDNIQELRTNLDDAQEAAIRLDRTWSRLREADLSLNGVTHQDVESWWSVALEHPQSCTEPAKDVLKRFEESQKAMRQAEVALQPWVIRHLKPKKLPAPFEAIERRRRLIGKSILIESLMEEGLILEGHNLVPFLLAARLTACTPESRPVFAEGLASSYEAFRDTRKNRKPAGSNQLMDFDDVEAEICDVNETTKWYLDELDRIVSVDQGDHPKIAATVQKALELWAKGEKVLIFCHYIATGRALRQYISTEISSSIESIASAKLGCNLDQAFEELDKIGKRFFDTDSPLRRACDLEVTRILTDYPSLEEHDETLISIVRRYVRTPSFLVRFFPLEIKEFASEVMVQAFDMPDASGLTLKHLLRDFLNFLANRCGADERKNYIDAVNSLQTGSFMGADVAKTFGEDELQGDRSERFVPNVRLVNGETKSTSRQRLMLTFNTPFFPEILIASAVLAEGVDLHMNCRYVIHHDLCWNPSTLEQRTGRVDRIGAKVERVGRSIDVYLPYIAETQDEKMYRVVMDRERWFKVVMGEQFKVDARTAEKLAERVPLPLSAAEALAFRLEVK